MEEKLPSKYSCLDILFTFGGLVFFLADILLDVWAVVTFYQEEAYVCLGFLVFLLVGSSALAQVYSWLWYSYDDYTGETNLEKSVNRHSLKALHVFQMGVYLRYCGLLEVSMYRFCTKKQYQDNVAVYLSHDLSMLRLIETFSESAPQLVLMITVILQKGDMEPMTMLKALGSASAIACSVTMYHRSLRSFLPDKASQTWMSSIMYFLWNLLLIIPRVVALALFISVLPCYIFPHFLSSWIILAFCAWRSDTDFMDSPGAEWLYRATVGLIWYFSWFNATEGQTKWKTALYHSLIGLDIAMLYGLWFWQITKVPPYFELTLPPYAIMSTAGLYIVGLILRSIYYLCCHSNVADKKKASTETEIMALKMNIGDTVDSCLQNGDGLMFRSSTVPQQVPRENKRMKKLAANFY